MGNSTIRVSYGENDTVAVISSSDDIMRELSLIPTCKTVRGGCSIEMTPTLMMWLIQSLSRFKIRHALHVVFDDGIQAGIMAYVNQLPHPLVFVRDGRVAVRCSHAALWDAMLRKVNVAVSNTPRGALVPVSNVRNLLSLNDALPQMFRITVSPEVLDIVNAPLPYPYDGTDKSLRHIPLEALEYVSHDAQVWSDRKANPAKTGDKLRAMGFDNLSDMLITPPMRYIDRSQPQDIRELLAGEDATVIGTITDISDRSSHLTVITVTDRNGSDLECQFFNGSKWISRTYRVGDEVIVNGKYRPFVTAFRVYPQMQHPTVDFMDDGAAPVIPVYHQSGRLGVSNWMLTSCIDEIVDRVGDFTGPQWLERALDAADISIPKDKRMSYGEALKRMHRPRNMKELQSASSSLAFAELVEMMTIVQSERRGERHYHRVSGTPDESLTDAYMSALPYSLTGSQSRVMDQIDTSMRSGLPMHALLVGDVGSGKTTIVHMSALKSMECGHQAVICAPTEMLAHQLYDVFMSIYDAMPANIRARIHPVLHIHDKGRGAAAKRGARVAAIASGDANLVFGTHGVFQSSLKWHDLGFVGIDEQHKFGAAQRTALLTVRDDGAAPDMLMQTATPIPRSIAQVYYGDVKYLRLDEMPSGRIPIETRWIKSRGDELLKDDANTIWTDVVAEARQGHGTFIICPMVEDSTRVDASNVKSTLGRVKSIMASYNVSCACVYGSQDPQEQHRAIEDFRSGATQVLIASSVVEVGVSCEHATRMIILDANRFGLASLHQMRGRIGRGSVASVCYLVGVAYTTSAVNRMDAITSTLDGWKLAKADLRNRGAGTMLDSQQSGMSDFRYANLIDNADWIPMARKIADDVLASDMARDAIDDSRRWFGVTLHDHILS